MTPKNAAGLLFMDGLVLKFSSSAANYKQPALWQGVLPT